MKLTKLLITVIVSLFVGCSHSSSFDRAVWIDNPDSGGTSNPRAWMVQDLIKNHLKSGMSRKEVLHLLGKPSKERFERRLPKKKILPDSISLTMDENLRPENSDRVISGINNFYKLHAKPVLIFRYPIGWSTMDPNFLIIKFNSKQQVKEYWVEQG